MSLNQRILKGLFGLEAAIAISAYVVIAGLLLADVAMRELGAGSIWGVQRISVYLMIVIGFLGLGLAASRGRHLRPRFLDGLFPEDKSEMANRIGSFIMMLVFVGFGVIGIQFLRDAIEYGDLARVVIIPIWYIQIVVPYAFFSTALRYAIFTISPELSPAEALE